MAAELSPHGSGITAARIDVLAAVSDHTTNKLPPTTVAATASISLVANRSIRAASVAFPVVTSTVNTPIVSAPSSAPGVTRMGAFPGRSTHTGLGVSRTAGKSPTTDAMISPSGRPLPST